MRPHFDTLIISCEHAGNRVPAAWRHLFASKAARTALRTHRGYDIGAHALARRLARLLDAPLVSTTISRLVVDTNRSVGHPALFSEFTRAAGRTQRAMLVIRYHHPHRQAVEDAVAAPLRS